MKANINQVDKAVLLEMPKDKFWEDYICAEIFDKGIFIEKNIELKEQKGLKFFELDIIKTDYNHNPPEIDLFEIKSTDAKPTDVFKFLGWTVYISCNKVSVNNKIFLAQEGNEENIKVLNDKFNKVGIKIEIRKPENKTTPTKVVWRYSFWLERVMNLHLLSRLNNLRLKETINYLDLTNNKSFFEYRIDKKLIDLKDSYEKINKISYQIDKATNPDRYKKTDDEKISQQTYNESYYKCKYNTIHMTTMIEHKIRLVYLKNIVDYIIYKKHGDKTKTQSINEKMPLPNKYLLPDYIFKLANEIILGRKHRYFYFYPSFWQFFLFCCGGILLNDYIEEEYNILSQNSGIPIDYINEAFEFYNEIFPLKNGWFKDLSDVSDSNIKILNLFSVPFYGLGAHYRKLIYTESKNFDDLRLTGKNTLSDLKKWNNLGVYVLNKGERNAN